MRFTYTIYFAVNVVVSYTSFSPLPIHSCIKAVVFCGTSCREFPLSYPLGSMMLYVVRTFLRGLPSATNRLVNAKLLLNLVRNKKGGIILLILGHFFKKEVGTLSKKHYIPLTINCTFALAPKIAKIPSSVTIT